MARKLLFISTINLATNPRILKEIKLAISKSYDVTFLGFRLGNWSDKREVDILKDLPRLKYIYLDATREQFFSWLTDSIKERCYRLLAPVFSRSISIAAKAHNKRTIAILRLKDKLVIEHYDLIIAHTLGSLYPAFMIAKWANTGFAFDLEDYHPGEHIHGNPIHEIIRRKMLLSKLLPGARYITAASSPIAEETTKQIPAIAGRVFPVLNSFSAEEFLEPVEAHNSKIKMIWFSQIIAAGRGLELIINIWEDLADAFELTLIGDVDHFFYKEKLEKYNGSIKILGPMSQIELHQELSKYDIGLALDLGTRDLNRNLALSNKIIAYYQAGLFIVATDTLAQKQFLNRQIGHGELFEQNEVSLLAALNKLKLNISQIRRAAITRFINAGSFAWSSESSKLENLWSKVLVN